MPEGCATWPAIWEAGLDTWPNDGEVDILEGVNNVSPNAMTIHTTDGCTMPDTRPQTGNVIGNNCGIGQDGTTGCGVYDANSDSYGREFNQAGGGWYAFERTESFIKIWFWSKYYTPPTGVQNGSGQISTDDWVS